MRSKLLLGGLLASIMIVPALAQSNPPASMNAPAAQLSTTTTAAIAHSDVWRSSKLIGLNVYNDQNEKLGDISEILLDKTGKVEGIVIGVGGFLGMGQHDIKVDMAKLKFVDEAVRTSATTTTTTATTTGAAPTTDRPVTTTTASSSKQWYPDHAILGGVSKDQLKAMPQFKYN
jgi:sporulation protein YlmC with PRC-barrel domain